MKRGSSTGVALACSGMIPRSWNDVVKGYKIAGNSSLGLLTRQDLPHPKVSQRVVLGLVLPFPRGRRQSLDFLLGFGSRRLRVICIENVFPVRLADRRTGGACLVLGSVLIEELILDALITYLVTERFIAWNGNHTRSSISSMNSGCASFNRR